MPSVIQSVAVISSETAAGYQDFKQQLEENAFGYSFNIDLFHSAVQGYKVRAEVSRALKQIDKANKYDCIAIIRGGGSKMDLAAFDDQQIAEEIAAVSIPVLTGIGHDIDNTVADIVAHTSIKTPTAVADFLIEHNSRYEGAAIRLWETISQIAMSQLDSNHHKLNHLDNAIRGQSSLIITRQRHKLDQTFESIRQMATQRLQKEKDWMQFADQTLDLLDPKHIMSRGFAAIKQQGKYKGNISQLDLDKEITIEMIDGVVSTIVKNKRMTPFDYDSAIKELQEILQELQTDDSGLETLSTKLKRAKLLLTQCRQKLREIETEISETLEDE